MHLRWICRDPGSKRSHPAQNVKFQEMANGAHSRPMKTRVNVLMKLTDNPNDVQKKLEEYGRKDERGGNPTGILFGGLRLVRKVSSHHPCLDVRSRPPRIGVAFVTRLAVCKLLLTSATGAPISAPASPDCSPECSGVPALEIRSDTSRVILA
jgi:hypothetical protein